MVEEGYDLVIRVNPDVDASLDRPRVPARPAGRRGHTGHWCTADGWVECSGCRFAGHPDRIAAWDVTGPEGKIAHLDHAGCARFRRWSWSAIRSRLGVAVAGCRYRS